MSGLIKSHIYQIRRAGLIKLVFLTTLFIQATMFIGELGYRDGKLKMVEYLSESGTLMQLWAILFSVIVVGYVCAGDFVDKTANYELMSGHTRAQTYAGKVIVSIVYGTAGYAIILAVPVLVGCLGFGLELGIDTKELLLRGLLSLFPAVRIMCEFIFAAFLIKNPYIIMACGYVLTLSGEFISGIVKNPYSIFLGTTCFAKLSHFESWATYTLQDTVNMIRVFEYRLSAGEIAGIALSSVILGAFFLYIGYSFFKKDDLR